MRDLLAELTNILDRERDCVYCSLVETRGSTPQKAGAAMLVFPDGSQCGTLGGGCVEAEVKRRALGLLAENRPDVCTFQLDSDYGWDDGLICGGRMKIIVEPIAARSRPVYFQRLAELIDTLKVFLEENCSPSAAVSRLAVHRNTLLYRLNKVRLLTGAERR